jgi:hypothetical protein
MDPRTLIWAVIIILYLIYRSRSRSKKPNQQNPPSQDSSKTPASSQPKRRSLEDVFRDVETRTKPFGDRSVPKAKTQPQKTQKPAAATTSVKKQVQPTPVQPAEVSSSEISKSQIGSATEGIISRPSYSFSLQDAVIASIILNRRNFNEVPQEEAIGPIFSRP